VTPDALKGALEGRGWRVHVVEDQRERDEIGVVPVDADGLMKCVDGRGSNRDGMHGPKALGGIYAIASLRGVRDVVGLKKIVSEVRAAGYVPSVHGDPSGALGCGYFKLWKTRQLPGLEPPEYGGDIGRLAVLEAGGVYEDLFGTHQEQRTIINLRDGETLAPRPGDQRFVLDAWVAAKFELDLPKYATLAAQTVELLGGKKIAEIVL